MVIFPDVRNCTGFGKAPSSAARWMAEGSRGDSTHMVLSVVYPATHHIMSNVIQERARRRLKAADPVLRPQLLGVPCATQECLDVGRCYQRAVAKQS
jgi:hypothetical protein